MFEARRPAEWWREHLDGVIGRPQDFKGICPAHPDEAPSLHVTGRVGKDALVKCFAGCKYEAIVAAIEATPIQRDVVVSFRPRLNGHAPAIRYEIRDVAGILRATHVRTDLANGSKSMTWEGGLNGLRAEDLPLYGSQLLPAWPTDEIIVVTEGEKAAQALLDAGFHALGTVTGAQATPSLVALGPLLGRPITFWPDADDVGLLHMSRLADELKAHGSKPRTVEPPEGVAKGWDAADAVEVLTPTQVEELIRQAPPSPTIVENTFWSMPLSEVADYEPQPLLVGWLDPGDHTILFGDGGTGKGIVAAWWTSMLVNLGHNVLLLDYERHASMEWKPRVRAFEGDLTRVHISQPTQAIWDDVEGIRLEVTRLDVTYLVIDSVGYACVGNDVEKSTTAIKYSAAIAQIGLPALSLAHTPKADVDPQHPFGSAFWSNGARLTYGMSRPEDPDLRLLTNRKSNQRAVTPPIELSWAWSKAGELPNQLVGTAATVKIVASKERAAVTILELLPDEWPGMSREELVTLSRFSYATVTRTLNELKDARMVVFRTMPGSKVLMYHRRVEK
jgi:hypothetical protein